jgi:hypothetical protein
MKRYQLCNARVCGKRGSVRSFGPGVLNVRANKKRDADTGQREKTGGWYREGGEGAGAPAITSAILGVTHGNS